MQNNVIEWCSPCHFETVIFKEFFSFINFKFVTTKWQNKSAPIEVVTRSEIFFSLKLELVTQKRKNKSLTIELVTRSEIKYFPTSR